MTTLLIDDTILNSDEAQAYFERADRRVMVGLRATCEILGILVPRYAERGKPGTTPAKTVTQAYQADNPPLRQTTLPDRKPDATPERVKAVKAKNAARLNPGLFEQTFPQ